MDASKFGFQPNLQSMESYLKDNEKSDGDGLNITWWSIPQGMSSIRILPPWDPTGRVALPVYSHPIEYQGKGMKYKKYSWTCVNRTFGKPCNICEGLAKIAASGVNVEEYEPSRRTFYLNAIVMFDPVYDRDIKSGKAPDKCDGVAPGTHVLMRAPKTLYDWLVTSITNPMIGDITSITNGIDVFITKEGSGLGTTYTPTLSPNGRTPIPQEYLDKIESLYNLDEVFSTGFDDEQINDLVASLNRSSGAFQAGIPNVANQMAGYQNPPYQQFGAAGTSGAPMPNMGQTVSAPPQFGGMPGFPAPNAPSVAPQFGQGISSTPMTPPAGVGDTPPWVSPVTAVAPSAPTGDQPECYGRYNSGDVKCVTCAHELACQKSSGK